jgi:ABC-type transport system involved in cytochrome bd biosynthesis fused ATPase/permease subunit
MRASEIQIVGRSLVQEDAGHLASPQTFRVDDVIDRVSSLRSGRITVRGVNGAGKSVLLSLIKEQLGERAFYLPAQHQLEIPGVVVSQSHGERAIAALEAVSQHDPSLEVLLLDEWDANLSAENRDMMSAKIETLSANKLVIEVRHNQENLALVPSYA